jgi:hypothetical protein
VTFQLPSAVAAEKFVEQQMRPQVFTTRSLCPMRDDQKRDDGPVVDLEVVRLGLTCAYAAAEVVHHENPDFEIRVFPMNIQEIDDLLEPVSRGVGFYLTSPGGQSGFWKCDWDRTRQVMEQVLRGVIRGLREWETAEPVS